MADDKKNIIRDKSKPLENVKIAITSVDLEFQTLLEQISSFAVTSIGNDEVLSISPINEIDEIEYQLDLVQLKNN